MIILMCIAARGLKAGHRNRMSCGISVKIPNFALKDWTKSRHHKYCVLNGVQLGDGIPTRTL